MPENPIYYGSPPPERDFDSQFARLHCVTSTRTTRELAKVLKVPPAAVSLIKEGQGPIPPHWLMNLFCCGINPEWILTGQGGALFASREEIQDEITSPPSVRSALPGEDLALNELMDALVRRIRSLSLM